MSVARRASSPSKSGLGKGCNWPGCTSPTTTNSPRFPFLSPASRIGPARFSAESTSTSVSWVADPRDVVGGGFNSGILATGAKEGAKYNYAPAPPEIMERVKRIEAVCADHKVPLPAAALQFVVAHPAIPTFMAGTRTVEQLRQNLDWFRHPIPADFWAELKAKGLLREDAPTP